MIRFLLPFFLISVLPLAFAEEAAKPNLPKVVNPEYDGAPVPPPEGAMVLFDGKDTAAWKQDANKKDPANDGSVKWKVENGYIEVVTGTGALRTREPVITSGHLHIEWATPAVVQGNGQGRGNSGIFIAGFPEVQVLDSYENETYPDGQAGALYKKSPPLVNACRKPGEWQCYDIFIKRATVVNGKITEPATITVRHNNVLVQDKVAFNNPTANGPFYFQDHDNPVRYRNIWFKAD
jgi:Domain of Unknown Function (DUF1080)